MILRVYLACVILLISGTLFAQKAEPKMHYQLSFPQAEAHYVEVTVHIDQQDTTKTTLVLPVWTPGYYKILDNPAHIIDFKAVSYTHLTLPTKRIV